MSNDQTSSHLAPAYLSNNITLWTLLYLLLNVVLTPFTSNLYGILRASELHYCFVFDTSQVEILVEWLTTSNFFVVYMGSYMQITGKYLKLG
jgi:hypothetical protein